MIVVSLGMGLIHDTNSHIHGRPDINLIHQAIILSLHTDPVFPGRELIQMGHDKPAPRLAERFSTGQLTSVVSP